MTCIMGDVVVVVVLFVVLFVWMMKSEIICALYRKVVATSYS